MNWISLPLRIFVFAVLLATSFGALSNTADVPAQGASQTASSTQSTAQTPEAKKNVDTLDWVPAFTVRVVIVFCLAGVLLTLGKLSNAQGWSLTAALSEKMPQAQAVAAANAAVGQNPAANPPEAPEIPSSSRLIAFIGMIAMVSMFIGLGLYLLWALFNHKETDAKAAMEAVGNYFLYGSALFSPYAFNQFKSMFKQG